MTIPYPEKYMKKELGIGKRANYQDVEVNTKFSSEKIPFGSPVEAEEDKVKVLADGRFYGVAMADNYSDEIPYDNGEKVGQYTVDKPVPILRKGAIWVKASEDVKESEPAAATATGFKVATASDPIVGVFESTAQAGGLVVIKINLP
ncbi:structural cement protein Gp24 [Enterococcus wangshanyuanii]|uniref:Capsid protein n=1 Tax=Enterococcus wangshanyuanii TaxID=2005703 RepID=A0ABQ1PJB9_9ENTE|nr:hypothetical protein [Enterococcus wangshanyuanii]GGC98093.1 hypothetical protein GCM10011573_29530 [Enterococcus wangshanyuanii]